MNLFKRCPNNGGFNILHKWKYVKYEFKRTIEGTEYVDTHDKYRVCENCGRIQLMSFSGKGFTLSEKESNIVKSMIVVDTRTNDLIIEISTRSGHKLDEIKFKEIK